MLIEPSELDDLKLEAKHTIDMARFVDLDQIDTRYFEKPYYLLPDGDQADEGYTVLRDALARTRKAGETPKVINIMDALKKSMHAKGQAKVKDAVRKRMGKPAPKRVTQPIATKARSGSRRSLH